MDWEKPTENQEKPNQASGNIVLKASKSLRRPEVTAGRRAAHTATKPSKLEINKYKYFMYYTYKFYVKNEIYCIIQMVRLDDYHPELQTTSDFKHYRSSCRLDPAVNHLPELCTELNVGNNCRVNTTNIRGKQIGVFL